MPSMKHIHREFNLEKRKGMQWGGVRRHGRKRLVIVKPKWKEVASEMCSSN